MWSCCLFPATETLTKTMVVSKKEKQMLVPLDLFESRKKNSILILSIVKRVSKYKVKNAKQQSEVLINFPNSKFSPKSEVLTAKIKEMRNRKTNMEYVSTQRLRTREIRKIGKQTS